MKIKELFQKDIERQINPAVVVSKQDDITVNSEIDEYVFTQTIIENLYKYLDNFINSKQDKTGIWINGFYGSGKSHFIKYIFYCFWPKYSKKAFEHYLEEVKSSKDPLSEASPGNIKSLQKKIEKINPATIIFNIDAVSGQRDEKEKITKIFFNQFNAFRGYNSTNIPLALLLEKHLDNEGLFDRFKKQIKEKLKADWESKATQIASLKLNDVLKIAKELDNSLDVDSMREKLKKPDDITIADHLIPEFVEYLAAKPDNYRLIFLVDEISQYIGSNANLLLNLQTIIEEVGAKCDNKIWLTCTAQQTLEGLMEEAQGTSKDFGKILGRFETRISLESQNTTFITQKRLLDKNSDGVKVLTDFYKKNKEEIENQFIFSHDRYRGFENKDEFVLSYPFVPYQFKLISDVFENFHNLGYASKHFRDSERSIIGITHFTAKLFKDVDVGSFITFDSFFNDQFKIELTHQANNILDPVYSIDDINNNKFARKVVHTLFMISNISDTKKLTFPPNIDNLVLLLLNKPDVNRLELQNKIQKILDLLVEKTIIYKEDERYNFYKEDEIDVAKQINNTTITVDDRLTYFNSDIFEKSIRFQRKVTFGNNNFSMSLNLDDKEIYRSGEINILVSVFDKTEPNVKALSTNKNDLVCCVNDWFVNDTAFRKDFEHFVKTEKFIRMNADSAIGTRKRAIEKFRDQSNKLAEDLRKRFNDKFNATPFISNQQIIKSSDITGSSPTERFNNAVEKHLGEIYKKNHLVNSYAKTNDDLKKSAADPQLSTDNNLAEAEILVNSYIDNIGDSITVADVTNQFQKPPYGWKDTATINILIKLFKKGKRKFEWRSDLIDINSFVEKALKLSERNAIVIKPQEEFGKDKIKDVRKAFRQIFNQDLKEDNDAFALVEEIKKNVEFKVEHYSKLSDTYFGEAPFGKHFNDFSKALIKIQDIRDPKALFDHLLKFDESLKNYHDNCKELEDFINDHLERYGTIRKFTLENQINFDSLDEAEESKGEILVEYFSKDDMPGDKFPQISTIYKELSKSLKSLIEKLKEDAEKTYEVIYKDLDKQSKQLNIKDISEAYQPKESKLKVILNEINISNLKLLISQSGDFRAKSIQSIINYKTKKEGKSKQETEVITDLQAVIQNEDDLDKYLSELRKRLLEKLKENKILIIK
ncbi:MAG: BREX system P-loop protein BrxC [Bacteroidetes bacterium]|nr:BREX system P-loop protein BrxC [Bacteroidota bacterium]